MKIEVSQENLTKALNTTSKFASLKAQLPVLGNILFSTKKTKLALSSTNLEVSVNVKIPAKVEEEGEITIPSRVISEIVANLNPGNLFLASEKEQLKITKDGFSSKVLGMNSSDFPKIPDSLGEGELVRFKKDDLSKALGQVLFATSIDETRPILTGVLMIVDGEETTLVATDGFRLSKKSLKNKSTARAQVVLPKSSISEVSKLFAEQDEIQMSYSQNNNQVLFGGGETVLSSRVISGTFPDFEKIIPKATPCKINVDKEDFLRAVKLSSVLARDSANIVKLSVTKSNLKLLAESSTAGSGETVIDAKVNCL